MLRVAAAIANTLSLSSLCYRTDSSQSEAREIWGRVPGFVNIIPHWNIGSNPSWAENEDVIYTLWHIH